ncbi:glycoside hydrolase family 3 N-terminal domain-containing protein [Salegentibacter chungangensis]|uniref:beta-glucosidase n=1 Tax=Salegentibacter chungangensis TaxID=1335724 RepID=A0ABW3NP08_9FLAO
MDLNKIIILFFAIVISPLKSPAQELPYQDASLSVEERLNDLMSRMTLEEKAGQMCQYVGIEHMLKASGNLTEEEMKKSDAQGFYPGIDAEDMRELVREGKIGSFLHVLHAEEANKLQKLAKESRLGIPLLIGIDAIHGDALVEGTTVYPSPISQAATWNDKLQFKASQQTAKEMRATGSHWSFTPNIDVLRDPRWGRTGETFGEDPYLVGNMGVATIKGLQSDSFGPANVIACAKHLIAGSQSVNGINSAPTDVSKRTLYEVFLPPYRRAIQEANVFSIMAAHNEVNGIPAHMHKALMTDLLREEWGFEGFYVSDWNDVSRIYSLHKVAESFQRASELAVSAGLDMHMHGPEFFDHVVEGVKNGSIPSERVEQACRAILEAKFRLGLFEEALVEESEVAGELYTPEHQATALQQAREAMTLLRNDNILPLQGSGKKLFITGPNANNMTTLGDWASPQPEDKFITVYEGIKELAESKGHSVDYFDIGERSKEITQAMIENAAEKAGAADVAVLVLGENSFRHDWPNKTTGENIDRASLQLSGNQLELAKAIHKAGKPVIVVYVSGSPISEPWLQQNARAILNAWEPGSFGGQAVAEVLFGDYNPGGKLPLTVPMSVGQLQMVYNHKPSTYKHKYHGTPKKPLYPFGYGLSYTSFEISQPEISATKTDFSTKPVVSFKVTNTGNMKGSEVVQLYIRDDYSMVTRPVKELKAYKRVELEPGETTEVEFRITPEKLAFYDMDFHPVVEEGDFTIMLGNSSADKDLKTTKLRVTKNIELIE